MVPYAATEERISELGRGSVVLVPRDTTSVNFRALKHVDGLGPIGTTADGAQGLHLHSSLALTEQGVPIEDKESWRWIKAYQALTAVQKRNPHIQLVSMRDREADIYEPGASTT